MQKLTTLIGQISRGRGPADYIVAYAYHGNKAINRKSFSLTVSKNGMMAAKVDASDRVDILVDTEAKTGMLTFSPTGDFCLSGKGGGKIIKISSATSAEFLPTVFPEKGGMQPLEITAIAKKSISFKLPL